MASVTEREHHCWLLWLAFQWDQPDRTDHYLMRLAMMWGKEGSRLSDYKLNFGVTDALMPKPKPTAEEISRRAKAQWFGMLGMDKDGKWQGGSKSRPPNVDGGKGK